MDKTSELILFSFSEFYLLMNHHYNGYVYKLKGKKGAGDTCFPAFQLPPLESGGMMTATSERL
jgi:hypothetical protein